jgi:hypothetical protein
VGAVLCVVSNPEHTVTHETIIALFAWLISHQPTILFSQNKPATSNQPAVLFSQNKSAPAISYQPNEQASRVWPHARTPLDTVTHDSTRPCQSAAILNFFVENYKACFHLKILLYIFFGKIIRPIFI